MSVTWKTMAMVLLSVVIAIGTGCKKEKPENNGNNNDNGGDNTITEEVRVTTYTPQDITASTAVCGGDVIVTQGLTLSEIGVCWSTSSNPTLEESRLSTTDWNAPFVCTLTMLEPDTKYYIRAYALRGLICYYGEEKSFTTESIDVRVTTFTPQDVTATTAVCGGDVVVSSGGAIDELGLCWRTSDNPTVEDFHFSTTNWAEPFVCTITDLEPGTTYHVRAYAIRGLECYYGDDKFFTTPQIINPEPSIAVVTGGNHVYDGQTIDLNQDYTLGFRCASNSQTLKELSEFNIVTKLYDLENNELDTYEDLLNINGTEFVFDQDIRFELRELIGKVTFIANVTDVDGQLNSATVNLNLNMAEQPLTVVDFEWYRQGNIQYGLEEYGLYWYQNAKYPFAQIKPMEGATLYIFDSSIWDEVIYESEKIAMFAENAITADVYNNVDVNLTSATYNDVIGTYYNGGYHLIHVTSSRTLAYQTPYGFTYYIYGQAK